MRLVYLGHNVFFAYQKERARLSINFQMCFVLKSGLRLKIHVGRY